MRRTAVSWQLVACRPLLGACHPPTTIARYPPSLPRRPARLARRARHVAAPVAALDPSAVDALYQVQEFGLAVMGIGLVSTFAAGTARIMSRAAGAYTATAAATVLEQAAAPAAPVAVAPSCDLPARAAEQPAVPAQASLGLGDLSELREAAAAAVAAVASTAAVSTTAAVSSEPAPAKAAAPAANGAAVKPGMTVEEATQVGGRGGQAGCTGRPHRGPARAQPEDGQPPDATPAPG